MYARLLGKLPSIDGLLAKKNLIGIPAKTIVLNKLNNFNFVFHGKINEHIVYPDDRL